MQQPFDGHRHALAFLDEPQCQRVALMVMHNRNRGVAVKMGGAGFRLAAHDFVFIFITLAVIRDQGQVKRNVV